MTGAAPKPVPTDAVLVDKVVAVVDERPITCSEVEVEARIYKTATGDCAGALGEVAPEEMALILEALIDRTLVLKEWGDKGLIRSEQLDADLNHMREACVTEGAWKKLLGLLELSEGEIQARRRQTIEAEQILTVRLARLWQLRKNQLVQPGDGPEAELQKREALLEQTLRDLREPAGRVKVIDDLSGDSC